jgi:L-asparaginase
VAAPGNARRGVLVIVSGGNIGLYADESRHEWVVRTADEPEIEEMILAQVPPSDDQLSGTIKLRENSVAGVPIHLTFTRIKADDEDKESEREREDLDSAQVDPSRWEQLAAEIQKHYNQYEGFVILHGLDTMAYTASALSFMLGNPTVPIVLTGAQRPLNFGRTDTIQNAISAIAIAASRSLAIQPVVKEVCVYSHDMLFRGNRVTMSSSSSYRSFDSPNYPPLAIAGEHIEIQRHVLRQPTGELLDYRRHAQARVIIIDVFPGMDATLIANLKDRGPAAHVDGGRDDEGEAQPNKPLRGVLLRTYGLGTAPTSPAFLTALDELVKAEIVVMNVTQARSGRISYGTDPVSLRLMEQGVVSGVDMTAEAAYAKMVVLLSQKEGRAAELGDELQVALCGEQSQSVFNLHFEPGETLKRDDGYYHADLFPVRQIVKRHELKERDIEHIQLRLLGVRTLEENPGPVELLVHLSDKDQDREEMNVEIADEWLRWTLGGRDTVNATFYVEEEGWKYVTDSNAHETAVVRLRTSRPISWRRLSIAIFVNVTSTES